MKSFELARPKSLDEAIDLLPKGRGPAEMDDARPLAGGQDLITEMKDYLVTPDTLVDLAGVPGLDAFDTAPNLVLGSLTRLSQIADNPLIVGQYTALAIAAESVASVQIRNQATLGGNLCQRPRCWYYRHTDVPCIKKGGAECFAESGLNKYNAIFGGGPSYIVHPSDCATALVALDATVTKRGARGESTMPLEEFFTLPSEGSVVRENVLKANELLVQIEVPAPKPGWKSTYMKFKERESFDFAMSAVAISARYEGNKIAEARMVLGAVAPIPWRASDAEEFLVGKPNTHKTWKEAAEIALADAEPLEHNGYKVPLTKGLIQKALRDLSGGDSK
jgi:xanthine dehydrogenase YagS FAD-binding subunit